MVDLNATQAAIRAGYSEKTAQEQSSRLLSNAMIAAEIAARRQVVTARNDITVDYVLGGLKKNYERSMQDIPVYDKTGHPTGEYQYEGSVANRSLELLGKHLRMFGDEKPAGVLVERWVIMMPAKQPSILPVKQIGGEVNGNGHG